MRNHLLIGLTVLLCNSALAQEPLELITYEALLPQIEAQIELENYNKSQELLNKVSPNDSSYCSTLLTRSYYYMVQSDYLAAQKVMENDFDKRCDEPHASHYNNWSISLINQEKYSEALEVIATAMKQYPKYSSLWFNKGLCYDGLEKPKEASEAYIEAIRINPRFYRSHLKLGQIFYDQGLSTQAFMSFNMGLMLHSDQSNSFTLLRGINELFEVENENKPQKDLNLTGNDETFEDLDLILNQRIALNDDYETPSEININLTRQLHMMLSQLKDVKKADGIWDQFYLPFYRWVQQQDHYNALTYTLSYSVENPDLKKVVEKKEDEIIDFVAEALILIDDLIGPHTTTIDGKEQELTYLYSDGIARGAGVFKNDQTLGKWTLYAEQGYISGEGSFNQKGERDGDWVWYYHDGTIKESADYKNGVLEGANKVYYTNGILKTEANYKNDNLNGTYAYYNEFGAKLQSKTFKNNELLGTYEGYFSVGEDILEYTVDYSNGGLANGVYKEYHMNGALYSTVNFVDDKKEGLEQKYNSVNTLLAEYNYKDGVEDGSSVSYHNNGQIKSKGLTRGGENEGAWVSYHSNGAISDEYNYDKGKLMGPFKHYAKDGKIAYEYEYRRGEIIAYKFYAKDGSILKEGRKKGGEFFYEGYSESGNVTARGTYDINGGKMGDWQFFDDNGNLSSEGTFDENKTNGVHKTYYPFGQLESIGEYKDDNQHGYFKYYAKDGSLDGHGWYQDGIAVGKWQYFYPNGQLKYEYFLHKGDLHGHYDMYTPDGQKTRSSLYKYGILVVEQYFDREGKIYHTTTYDTPGTSTTVYNHFNGKPSASYSISNGKKQGPYTYHDYYGQLSTSGEYINDSRHGEWVFHYPDGTLRSKAIYEIGERHGEDLDYYEDGTLENKSYYAFGKPVETWYSYHENGALDAETIYEDGVAHGPKKLYNTAGELQLIRYYEYGRLVGYTYEGPDGNLVETIPIKNESGEVISYYPNGQIARKMLFENGKITGDYKEFYPDGTPAEELSYLHGDYHGTNIEYYENGKKQKEESFVLDNKHGMQTLYYQNGNKKRETPYVYGEIHGEVIHYDQDGKVTKKEVYNDDLMYESTQK